MHRQWHHLKNNLKPLFLLAFSKNVPLAPQFFFTLSRARARARGLAKKLFAKHHHYKSLQAN